MTSMINTNVFSILLIFRTEKNRRSSTCRGCGGKGSKNSRVASTWSSCCTCCTCWWYSLCNFQYRQHYEKYVDHVDGCMYTNMSLYIFIWCLTTRTSMIKTNVFSMFRYHTICLTQNGAAWVCGRSINRRTLSGTFTTSQRPYTHSLRLFSAPSRQKRLRPIGVDE